MRAFFRKLQRKEPEPRRALPRSSPLGQRQCVLFEKLSTELRLLIYEEVLADPDRLLHFLHINPLGPRPRTLGHWRCETPHSKSLTWQHGCFGLWVEGDSHYCRDASRTNSDLISLLLTCRLVYCEAVDVLYQANLFSFRGIAGISSFRTIVAPNSWNMLRKLHISTTFSTPMERFIDKRYGPPQEDYQDWENGCHILASLHELRVLRVEIMVRHQFDLHNQATESMEQEVAVFVLSALKLVTAQEFFVELNLELSHTTMETLGDVPFQVSRHTKAYDWKNFSL